ncbi:MAG TPA: LLM class F420-dependent oxidoreductase, partial [Dehalococcoidia bacterium]|nr:LLM class F420-dependent oxidoreductase [Dehalococcoidia bacterium]
AERLGYDSIWKGESYGTDTVTPLAFVAARTSRLKLGMGILQIPARTPAMTAMTMSTLDVLSGGRVLVGLGMSNPQVAEGWHGVPYGKPMRRTREYVEILRRIWAREKPVEFHGQEYDLPYQGPGATGLGKPLRSILHGRQLPIYLATLGPASVRMTAEIADGWLPIHFSPQRMDHFRPLIEEGFRRAGGGKSWENFDIVAPCRVIVNDDVGSALASLKPHLALYVGGMGAREKNFYNELVTRYGYGDAAARVQDLYLAGRKDEAAAAVPDDLVDEVALCGPEARIRERFRIWAEAGVNTLVVQSQDAKTLRLMADIAAAKEKSS